MGYTHQSDSEAETVFDKPAYWKIKWNKKDARSAGECVQLQNERFIHADCAEQVRSCTNGILDFQRNFKTERFLIF